MKIYLFLFLFLSIPHPVFSQETPQIDNALLLDYYQNQHFDLASAYLKKNCPEPVHDLKILKALAYCAQMNGKLPEAESYYERIFAIDSTSTSVLYSLGSINLRRGNSLKAEAFYKKIILRDSTNFIVYKQLAKLSMDKNDIPSTINYLQKANRLNPQEPDIASDLADLYISLKLYPSAEGVLNMAIIADTDDMTLLESLAKLEYSQKKWPETASTCEQLIQLGNASGAILTKLGIAYYNMNDYKCSIEIFAEIADNEQTETTFYYTAACYKELKDYNKAITYFQKTIDAGISTNINSYYTEIADTYETIKNFKSAAFAYQKALQFDETPITLYSLANLYDAEVKDKKTAIKYYKKYLAANPPKTQQNYITYVDSRVKILSKR